ncbi:hypothetical protein Pst134EB_003822 [Puccinia striiformis f. sp. tritici]|nr:hypothetical protein Pst134EB_003822 [Puccinia striiformis f. sp. tritici]
MASRSNQQKKLRLLLLDMSEVQHNSKEILDAKKLSKFQTNFLLPAHLHNQLISLLNLKYKPSGSQFAGLIYMNSSNKGSSSISYCLGSTPQAFGTIVHMFQTVLFEACGKGKCSHKLHTLMCVQRRERLSPFNEMKKPYSKACPGIKSKLFYAPPEMDHADRLRFCDLILPNQIIYHTALFLHNKSVFGTKHHTIAVRSLDWNQAGLFQ